MKESFEKRQTVVVQPTKYKTILVERNWRVKYFARQQSSSLTKIQMDTIEGTSVATAYVSEIKGVIFVLCGYRVCFQAHSG